MKKLGIKTIILSGLVFAAAAQAEVAVIVNSSNSQSLDNAKITNIFLGKDKSLKAIDLNDATKTEFYEKLAGKNEAQMKSYWSGLVFTGKGTPPKGVDTPQAVIDYIKANADGIGYVPAGSVDPSVKVLKTIK